MAQGAVAAGHALTVQAAAEILRAGGNAVDAAVAAAWMACVVEPVLASPGGGGFAMVHAPGGGADVAGMGETAVCDFFAQTPGQAREGADFRAVEADFGTTRQTFHIGPGSVAVPGFVPGLFALHERYGRRPMAALLAPARQVAAEGHAVNAFQAFLFTVVAPILTDTAEVRALFAPVGALLKEGEQLVNPELARLFERLAAGGLAAWQEEVVPALLSVVGKDGHLRQEDFEAYAPCWRAPLETAIGGGRAWLNPPPAAGGVMVALAAQALSEIGDDGCRPCAWAQALDVADMARRAAGDDVMALFARLHPPAHKGTTHISVVDSHGLACAMTVSNGEGNGQIVPGFGFMPNNMLGEADVNPHGAQGWPEGVRLSSMMAPTIAERADGSFLALGSGGSNRIRSVIFLVLQRLLRSGEPLEDAIAAPRLHVEDGHLDVEPGFSQAEREALAALFPDHRFWPSTSLFFGGCHAVERTPDNGLHAHGDSRRAGYAAIL